MIRALALLSLALSALAGCDRRTGYPQSTPDEVVASARDMVLAGEADRLPDLVYADSEAMRATLDRLGRVLGRLQSFSDLLKERFPDEIAAARTELEEQGLGLAGMGRSRGRGGDVWNDALRRLFADPYAWAEESADRLSTITLSEQSAAILFDEQAVLPPFGLTMKLAEDDKWYIVAPIQLPVVSRFMPKTDQQWAIVAYLFQAVENAIIDLEDGIRDGSIASLKDASREAGTMLFAPAAAIGLAYSKTIEEQREARPDGG